MSHLLSRKEAALRLGISLVTLDEERRGGHIAFVQRKPGGKVWITEAAIEEYLARATHPARPVQLLNRPTYRKRRVK